MATKMTVALEDDLDGGPANETVRFGLDSAQYEIDLNKKHARAFRKKIAPFVEHARKARASQLLGRVRPRAARRYSVPHGFCLWGARTRSWVLTWPSRRFAHIR